MLDGIEAVLSVAEHRTRSIESLRKLEKRTSISQRIGNIEMT